MQSGIAHIQNLRLSPRLDLAALLSRAGRLVLELHNLPGLLLRHILREIPRQNVVGPCLNMMVYLKDLQEFEVVRTDALLTFPSLVHALLLIESFFIKFFVRIPQSAQFSIAVSSQTLFLLALVLLLLVGL